MKNIDKSHAGKNIHVQDLTLDRFDHVLPIRKPGLRALLQHFIRLQEWVTPHLVSGTTNEDGDLITLVFDRDMSDFFGSDNGVMLATAFKIRGASVAGISAGLNTTDIDISLNTSVAFGDVPLISYDGTYPVLSLAGGILAPFENFEVTNIVPET